MKVVHVGYNHRPDDIRIFYKECRTLVGAGYNVTYITSNKNTKDNRENYICDGVYIDLIPIIKAGRVKRYLQYCRDLKSELIALDADIYHLHEFLLLPVMGCLHKKGKKIIYDLHEDTPRQMEPMLKKQFGNVFGRFLERMIELYENHWIKHVDYVIAATPHIAKRCSHYTDKVEIVANYPIIQEDNEEVKPISERERQVCYTGGISEINGILNIAEAMSQVKGNLILAGDITKDLQDKLTKYPGWVKVNALGYVNRSKVQQILHQSMAGLALYLPSGNTMNALPNKIFEYMEAGLPVIASNFPLWEEIIEGNECGICVDPQNPDEISKAINQIFENPQHAERMGENGRKAICEKYNWGGAENEFNEGLSGDKHLVRICYCGGLSEARNITMYVDMMEEIDGELFLAGDLDPSYQKELQTHKGWEKVKYLGYLNRSEVNDLYMRSDIGLCVLRDMPNIYYSLPIKLFEYMEAGLPVICSDFPIWENVIDECQCGVCVPYDNLEKLIKAVQTFVKHPEMILEMGLKGREAVKNKYNYKTQECRLIEVYHLLEGKKCGVK